MPVLELKTIINAPVSVCFDLARSIDLHKISVAGSREEAVAGTSSGLIGLNEEVTWEGTHFGFRQKLTSRITAFTYPYHFRDEMTRGIFRMLRHDHYFEEEGAVTTMKDRFEFAAPFGICGRMAEKLFLNKYLTDLLTRRNQVILEMAEGEGWKGILNKNL